MKKAERKDKSYIIDILANSFDKNQSINYLIPQDKKRLARIRALMDYSFEMCFAFGEVYLSHDNKACVLILFPEQQKTNLTSIYLDLKLILTGIGFKHIRRALKLKSNINRIRPQDQLIYYLWYIGVHPSHQHAGAGSKLLNEIIADSKSRNRPIYLETSTVNNIDWYEKFGFKIYQELDVGYCLYFLRREI